MSNRARRADPYQVVEPYSWAMWAEPHPAASVAATPHHPVGDDGSPIDVQAHLAALEREAFAKGFEQGERAGAETASMNGQAMLQRLTASLEEVAALRTQLIRDTEQQMVRLALAVARRIIHREVAIDRDLLLTMARVAMDRVGDATQITVRLNPDDHAAIAHRAAGWPGHVRVVPDARLPHGGCRIESDLGSVDAGIEAQLHEVAHALLHDSANIADPTLG